MAVVDTEATLVAAGCATEGRFWHWVPASYAKLQEAERKILTRAVSAPYEMKKVAQLGTLVVPCSDEKKRREAGNLVLIHGFAGGNAVWALVTMCPLRGSSIVGGSSSSSSPLENGRADCVICRDAGGVVESGQAVQALQCGEFAPVSAA